ncbi:MAG: NAD(P)H-quinone oxidoreductase [Pseudomonadota bacterium]
MTDGQRRYVHIEESDRSLGIREDDVPQPGAEELLIEVAAAGINRADLLQRKGFYPPPEDASPIMGLEVAGKVVAMGAAVKGWQLGDSVCALVHGGGYASHALAPATQCLEVPAGYSLEEAAALPEALLTVWHNVFQRAGLRLGETILVHGGASGIGSLGVAICRAWGARVFSTAGTEDKCRAVESFGAERCFNYQSEDFERELERLGLKNGIDVILDMVGGDYVSKNFSIAAPEGRIVNIAFQRGFDAQVNFLPLLLKRLTLTGSTLRAQSAKQKAQMVVEINEKLFEHLASGAVKPVLDKQFSLSDCAEAHAYMEEGSHTGKILLIP